MASPVVLEVNPFADAFVVGDGEEEDEEPPKVLVSEHTNANALNPILQQQAIQLMLDLFPDHTAADVEISHIHSSPQSLTVNISIFPSSPSPSLPWYTLSSFLPCSPRHRKRAGSSRYTLRIPHTSSVRALTYEVTTLSYLSHTLPYPIPKVVVYDSSTSNALDKSYILYERLPGRSLRSTWASLNAAQRASAARGIAGFIHDLGRLRSKCPGLVSVWNTVFDFKQDVVRVEEMPLSRSPTTTTGLPPLAAPMSTREFLLDLAKRQQASAVKMGIPAYEAIWTRIEGMIESLHSLGVIPDAEGFCLHHPNLTADNILIAVLDDRTVKITGFLSWDNALFGPKFLAMHVPQFMPSSGEGEAVVGVLAAFETVLGVEWCRMANRPELELARKLWGVLLKGMVGSGDVFAAEEILDEFEKVGA
ncbi:phosphotransferase enzyme family [Pyrenophora seminiperda CCB06]|uniref:Phosphotransferase enzyme family n=1 Tax=Pyrenophora seminiperda CCB06 TaxID=1302712 RepID=A0A3M7LX42_9PLEO|nr:phosphotransferase enzyme family [Pyrenophora seminiperda CCB06]